MTIQGVDFGDPTTPASYHHAWMVQNAQLAPNLYDSPHSQFGTAAKEPATLVFVAAPNAKKPNAKKTFMGKAWRSMERTYDSTANGSYDHFRDCIVAALAAGLDAAVADGCDTAIVPNDIFKRAGPHKLQINQEFDAIVDALAKVYPELRVICVEFETSNASFPRKPNPSGPFTFSRARPRTSKISATNAAT